MLCGQSITVEVACVAVTRLISQQCFMWLKHVQVQQKVKLSWAAEDTSPGSQILLQIRNNTYSNGCHFESLIKSRAMKRYYCTSKRKSTSLMSSWPNMVWKKNRQTVHIFVMTVTQIDWHKVMLPNIHNNYRYLTTNLYMSFIFLCFIQW